MLEQAITLSFKASNNEAEYKTLLAGFRMARDLAADNAYTDVLASLGFTLDHQLKRSIPVEYLDKPSIETEPAA
ncbi:hypothetical protein ACFX14_037702 [Malus domestica]